MCRLLLSLAVLRAPCVAMSHRHTQCVTGCRTFSTAWFEALSHTHAVQLAEQMLLSVQHMTGVPWWVNITCSTVALRTCVTLPLSVYQAKVIAKVEALQPEIADLSKRLSYEVSVYGRQHSWSERTCRLHFRKNLRRIVSQLYVRDNCHPFKASVLLWIQMPLWICVSLALRNLSMNSSYTVLQADLAVGGALWFTDLTLPDSTWIIPVSLGLVNLLIVEIFALQTVELSRFQKYITHFIRVVSVAMIPIAASVPASMALYWLSSSCVGLIHNLLLRSPRFRRLCRLPFGRLNSPTPYRDLIATFTNKYLR